MNKQLSVIEVVAECEAAIKQMDPTFIYNPGELFGFVTGCHPSDDSPEDIARDFMDAVKERE